MNSRIETLNVDIETFSSVDLLKVGVYRYVEAPDFEVLLFGYSINRQPKIVIDLAQGEVIPREVVVALFNPSVIKRAFNANFEIVCLSKHFGQSLSPEQWRCTQVLALYLGLPNNLYNVSRVVSPKEAELHKSATGKALIRFFCCPCKPTKKNGGRTRNLPHHDPAKWALIKEYCGQDVVSEAGICDKLLRWAPPLSEQKLWTFDQLINSRGMLVDRELVRSAIAIDAEIVARNTAEFVKLTGIEKATQVAKLKKWLATEHDLETDSLDKEHVKKLLSLTDNDQVERALQLRQQLSKSSVAKYKTIKASVCADGRVRGLLQFYGANRTGRWAGRLLQVHNLPKSNLSQADLALAREIVKSRDIELLEMLFGYIPSLLSQLIRTVFIAPYGMFLLVIDFAAIEARVLAWAANETWRLEVFRTHGRIYEASASTMFGVPLESIDKHSPLRQKGKVAELALGYHGAEGALITMGALDMGLTMEELPGIVSVWRAANENIMQFGWKMASNAKRCIRTRLPVSVEGRYGFRYESGMLFMDLPSGRSLCYAKPRLEQDGKYTTITYDGMDQKTKRWGRTDTYAGKLLENYTQAVARDCLAEALPELEAEGMPVICHIHDEGVAECDFSRWPDPEAALAKATEIFSRDIVWAPGLPLKGDGFISQFYRKDA